MWDKWFMIRHDKHCEFCPIEVDEEGRITNVIVGMTMLTTLESMHEKGYDVWEVDDMYEPTEITRLVRPDEDDGS